MPGSLFQLPGGGELGERAGCVQSWGGCSGGASFPLLSGSPTRQTKASSLGIHAAKVGGRTILMGMFLPRG